MASFKYKHTFFVSGSGAFPLDMLRYDCCHPVGSEDATEIAVSFSPEMRTNRFSVKLARYTETQNATRITDARWKSFGWEVHDVRTEKL